MTLEKSTMTNKGPGNLFSVVCPLPSHVHISKQKLLEEKERYSTEAERAASGVRRFKTPYRSTMSDTREGNLNLIQLQSIVAEIEIDKVVDIFKRMIPRRMFDKSLLFE